MVRRGDEGQAVVLVAGFVVLLCVVALLVVGRVGGAVVERARAHAAADAAALAGVASEEDEAGRVAEANGAELESFVRVGDEVEVTVRVGDFRATARARLE